MAALNTCPPLTRQSVLEAATRIAGHVHRTPIITSRYVDNVASTPQTTEDLQGTEWEGREPARPRVRIFFKCENLQRVGAFKPRGAFNALLRYMQEDRATTNSPQEDNLPRKSVRVVTHSSGNHAQAVALAAGELGLRVSVVMPSISTPSKIAATRGYGAEVHFSGPTGQERQAVVDVLMADTMFDNVFVPPYNHPDTLLGQGTIGLEVQDQVPIWLKSGTGTTTDAAPTSPDDQRLHAIIAPCGGGGMLSGIALSCQGTGIKVFGAEPSFQGADDCRRGLLAHQHIDMVRSLTIADGLRTSVGPIPWSVISDPTLVAGVYAVTEDQIRRALRMVFERLKIVIEPSSAVPLAVVLYNEEFRKVMEREIESSGPWNLGLVVSGGNTTPEALAQILSAR